MNNRTTHRPLIVANWKAYRPYRETLDWCTAHAHDVARWSTSVDFMLCPDMVAFAPLATQFTGGQVRLVAQRCDAQNVGAHTGAVTATSLAEAGAWGALVGHAEHHATIDDIIAQTGALWHHPLTPLICITEPQGATLETYASSLLHRVCDLARAQPRPVDRLICAIEPRASIGTNTPWSMVDARSLVAQLTTLVRTALPQVQLTMLYGGSVTPDWVRTERPLELFGGLLIGRASLDRQALETMVELARRV